MDGRLFVCDLLEPDFSRRGQGCICRWVAPPGTEVALGISPDRPAMHADIIAKADRLRAGHPKAMVGYVIWSRRDIRTTAYAAAYLKANLPTASPQSCSEGRTGLLQ